MSDVNASITTTMRYLDARERTILVQWFLEAYASGWRPTVHAPHEIAELVDKLVHNLGWMP